MKGIADTGFLVAFVNRADEHHDWAVSIAEQVTEPLIACGAVPAAAPRGGTWLGITFNDRYS